MSDVPPILRIRRASPSSSVGCGPLPAPICRMGVGSRSAPGSAGCLRMISSCTSTPKRHTAPPIGLQRTKGRRLRSVRGLCGSGSPRLGYLALADEGKNTTKATIGAERQRVITVALASLYIVPEWGRGGQQGRAAPKTAETAASRPHSVPPLSEDAPEWGQIMGAAPEGNGGLGTPVPSKPPAPPLSAHNTDPAQSGSAQPNGAAEFVACTRCNGLFARPPGETAPEECPSCLGAAPEPPPAEPIKPRRKRAKLVDRKLQGQG